MSSQADLATTPLTVLHEELGGRLVPFAGYSMPVQFPAGVKQEHLHTREQAGLFDVSHMGQLWLTGPDMDKALEALIPADICGLKEGRQRYGLLTNESGGILDDLMISRHAEGFYLVVNAACKQADIAHLRAMLPAGVHLEEMTDRALLALQGPQAEAALAELQPAVRDLVFMDNVMLDLMGEPAIISRSGYTGEDGYEISCPAHLARQLAETLLADERVKPIGLGARDSLRLEAGLCLYGHDIDTATTPVEASLNWAIGKARRSGGERAGGFPGAQVILPQLAKEQPITRRRVGLEGQGRAPVREGSILLDAQGKRIGAVTSGTFGPSVGKAIAMGYVSAELAEPGTEIQAEVRGKLLPMRVCAMPFKRADYKR
ncbi:MAG: glycine cleavage system aminomethyltransferase GcvT [Natronospirillum sp.]|uniref:glycine cleavage system aminomethyltransferase GcvT n=1 Tax=Natronospirillum sp. TaxID=2812955 RepID=UPI0025DAD1F5|nr:glycine cleavage system aminomethyltransferase GcvT [Natronospirillum sp.]MCH8550344.1 glycine cleavage system aminomethyltransferase GcvT [Natronospirillum sp.]